MLSRREVCHRDRVLDTCGLDDGFYQLGERGEQSLEEELDTSELTQHD